MTHSPTAEQSAIFDAALNSQTSLIIEAFAGCGKTSTLEMLSQRLPQQPALALAFNVKIKKELESRLPSWFEVRTFNGLGHSAWGKVVGRCEVDDRKIGKLVTQEAKVNNLDLGTDQWNSVKDAINRARHAGLIPQSFPQKGLIPDTISAWEDFFDETEVDPKLVKFARHCLTKSINAAFNKVIDYDDQIYMSALFGGVFPRYDLVLVDEAQDLSPLNHRQIARCAGPNGRLIVVGDPKQAIYAFRGADSKSIFNLRTLRTEWTTLPLATTFRCPHLVVKRQQGHAKGFVAWETNIQGEVLEWAYDHDSKSWDWQDVVEALPTKSSEVAILCRNNAPLMKMAFKLIRDGVGVQMLGRDIGKNLVALAKKIIPGDIPVVEAVQLVRDWMGQEKALAEANDKPEKVASITDRGECLLAVLESGRCKNGEDLQVQLSALFARDHGVTLSSIHRSKGLEWPLVIHLDPWRIPSKFAQQAGPAAVEQEMNLKYVCETRSKHTLILANLEDFKEETGR